MSRKIISNGCDSVFFHFYWDNEGSNDDEILPNKEQPNAKEKPSFWEKKNKTNKKIPNYFETFENIRKDSISISILFSHDFA